MGTLRGFDEYVNMVLDDVVEIKTNAQGIRRETRLEQILLNGNHICLMVPGEDPTATAASAAGGARSSGI